MNKQEVIEQLKKHLQVAVMIEFSTLPPYLCACWSIFGNSVNALHVKKFILSIVQEEMLHMAMACNILNAIGGGPVLNDPDQQPVFPCSLPGHSKTNNAFTVELNKCCPAAISTFLRIELPEEIYGQKHHHDGWCTIAEFYREIKTLLQSETLNDADFNHGRQAANAYNPGNGILYEVQSRSDALAALNEIIDQGEGHSGKMYDMDHQLTHYWKFRAIFDLMENGIWHYDREVYPVASNPNESLFSEEAKRINQRFNITWSAMLDELNIAFNSEKPVLDRSIELMQRLKEPAVALMQMPLVGKTGNAAPTFRYIQVTENSLFG